VSGRLEACLRECCDMLEVVCGVLVTKEVV
jgi:hypothetical protein